MDGRHGARLAKQFKCLDDRKKLNRWGFERAVSQKWLEVARLALAHYCRGIARQLLIDINQNDPGEASADPRRGAQIVSNGKLHFFEVFFPTFECR